MEVEFNEVTEQSAKKKKKKASAKRPVLNGTNEAAVGEPCTLG